MDILNTFLSVPANRTIVKLVLAVICVVLLVIALFAFLSDYTSRLVSLAILGILVRIVQAEVNHTEMKDLLNKR